MHYGGEAPVWVTVLVAAEAWGKAPWELAGGKPLLWFWRFCEYNNAMAKRDNPSNNDNLGKATV